jgi:hypothetical protein
MLLKKQVLDGIADGRITVAFRRWKRPTVKTGGSLRTTVGLLAIEFVEVVDEERITKQDAKRAGFVDNILARWRKADYEHPACPEDAPQSFARGQ